MVRGGFKAGMEFKVMTNKHTHYRSELQRVRKNAPHSMSVLCSVTVRHSIHKHTGGEWITSIITAPPFQGPLPQRPKWQAGKHGLALPKQPYQSVTHCYTSFQFLHNTRILQSGASMYGTHYVCICVLMCGCVSAPLLDSECMRPVHAYSCFWIQECTRVHLQNTKTKWPRTVVKEVPWLLSPHG